MPETPEAPGIQDKGPDAQGEKGPTRTPAPRPGGGTDRHPKTPLRSIVAAWIGRQSVPRLLGLIVGNTRDLEARLAEKDALLASQREEVLWWRAKYGALLDSVFMRQGMLPASGATPAPPRKPSGIPGRIISPRSMELDAQADRLLEMMQRGDPSLLDRLDDLAASPQQKDREVLKRFNALVSKDEELMRALDIGMGVEVM